MTDDLKQNVIVIDLRESRRKIMLNVREDVIYKIDKFIMKTVSELGEDISRNYLLTRLTEALATALEANNFDIEKIEIKVTGKNKSTSIVLYTRKVME